MKSFYSKKMRFAVQCKNFIGKKHAGGFVKFSVRTENDLGKP